MPLPDGTRAPLPTTLAAVLPEIKIGEVPAKPISNKNNLVGIGGWLALVAIGQVLGTVQNLGFLITYYSSLDADLWTKFPIAAYGEALLNVSLSVIIAWTTYLLFSKSRLFPRFFVLQYVASILLFPLDIVLTSAVLSAYTGQSVDIFTDKMTDPTDVAQWIVIIIGAAIWIPYIKLSKRVANTFGKHSAADAHADNWSDTEKVTFRNLINKTN
jgi:hypothetical protein